MYSNIGGKLRTLAGILGTIGILATGLGLLLVLISFGNGGGRALVTLVPGLVLGVIGLLEIVSTWPLYAFGQMVEDVHALRTGNCEKQQSDELPDL